MFLLSGHATLRLFFFFFFLFLELKSLRKPVWSPRIPFTLPLETPRRIAEQKDPYLPRFRVNPDFVTRKPGFLNATEIRLSRHSSETVSSPLCGFTLPVAPLAFPQADKT